MNTYALLFTDVVDSTAIASHIGVARTGQLWADHDGQTRPLLARYRGREIDRTDGYFLLFDDVTNAARYAVAYHQILAKLGLCARVGLNVGMVTLRENVPEDIARGAKPIEVEGLAKPLAARIMALAQGGQTLLSADAQMALGESLPEGTELESHGHYRLKGIEEPVEVFELGVRDLSPFSPPMDVDKAYRVVRVGDLWRPAHEVRHNLPAERDAFVGRNAELRMLAQRLDSGARLVTVLGPGGAGKTRFVRRYGWIWLGDWPGGIFFCDLSEARSLDGLLFAVASALEVPLSKVDPVVQLGHAIAGRGHCLVVLDNFEHLVEHAPATLGCWLDRAASAAFVVTSRERLHLAGEEILLLGPLPLASDAIDLFAIRTRAQRPDFVLGEVNREAVSSIVQLLDGLPLAIELAAARMRVLSAPLLLNRLKDRFALLAGVRGVASRQATLRTAIDWSWGLLTALERVALAQCAVFEGGFTLDAAESVLDLSSWSDHPPTVDVIQALVDKSLLRTWVPVAERRYGIDELCFGMYASIHEYAHEKLRADSVAGQAADVRHGCYFARLGVDERLDELSRHGGVKRRRMLALQIDNLVAACRRAVGRGDGQIAGATYRAAWEVLELQGPVALAIDLGSQVLAVEAIPANLRPAVMDAYAMALQRSGRVNEAGSWFHRALALAQETHDLCQEGRIVGHLGTLPHGDGGLDQSLGLLQSALTIHREVGDRVSEGIALGNLGSICFEHGRLKEALDHYESALAVHREVGNRRVEGSVLVNLGLLHSEQGRTTEARLQYDAALAIHQEVGSRRFEATTLGNVGFLCRRQGRLQEAKEYLEAALMNHRAVGNRREEGIVVGELGVVAFQEGQLSEAHKHLADALTIMKEVGYRRGEGAILSDLGNLLLKLGRTDEARDALHSGELLLRAANDPLSLGKLLCIRGRLEVAAGRHELASPALAEAEALALDTAAGPDSELGDEIGKLREALARTFEPRT